MPVTMSNRATSASFKTHGRSGSTVCSTALFQTVYVTINTLGWIAYAFAIEERSENIISTFLLGSSVLGTSRTVATLSNLFRLTSRVFHTTTDEEDFLTTVGSLTIGIPCDLIAAAWSFWAWRDYANNNDLIGSEYVRVIFLMHLAGRVYNVFSWYIGLVSIAFCVLLRLTIAEKKNGNFELGPRGQQFLFLMGGAESLMSREEWNKMSFAVMNLAKKEARSALDEIDSDLEEELREAAALRKRKNRKAKERKEKEKAKLKSVASAAKAAKKLKKERVKKTEKAEKAKVSDDEVVVDVEDPTDDEDVPTDSDEDAKDE